MKKELSYFKIENAFGGSQDWFRDPIMNMGGCGAAAACDVCINAALHHKKDHLYPYDVHGLNKQDYIKFSSKMKPYLRPRIKGIDTLEIFMDGFHDYLNDVGEHTIKLSGCHGDAPVTEAVRAVKQQIDQGIAIPYLMLRHENVDFKDLVWHWFMLVGYEEVDGEFYIKTATYGGYRWISLRELWATGYQKKGGMVMVNYS